MIDSIENKPINQDVNPVDIVEFLRRIGIKPESVCRNYAIYRIPFSLMKPNIRVNRGDQTYSDSLTKTKGNLLKLVQKIFPVVKSDAIRIINDTMNLICPEIPDLIRKPYYFFKQDNNFLISDNSYGYDFPIRIGVFKPIFDKDLSRYLWKLKIKENIARAYCQQVQCEAPRIGISFTDLAFQNDSNSYYLFNAKFYGNVEPVDIRTIKGIGSTGKLLIFPNVIEFLSYLTIENKLQSENDVIVLNSKHMLYRSILISQKYQMTDLYLGNDIEGIDLTHIFQVNNSNSVNGMKANYSQFNSLNDFLRRRRK